MSFLDTALPLAKAGFRVFPLVPNSKRPLALSEGDHFDAATIDPEQIELWAKQIPNANVGLCPDEHFCFVETDDDAALHEKCADLPSAIWDTMRVSARENRCYYVFRQTMRTRKAGNMTVTRERQDNLFEFKQHRVYVVGPGSIHPKTGKPYVAEWRSIPAIPDALLNRLCELYGAPGVSTAVLMNVETQRETATLDRFLEYCEVPTIGDWRNKGKQWFRSILCPWATAHENTNEGTSTCIVYTEGGGYGFDCKHRCSEKTWKEFRLELESRFPDKPRFAFLAPGPSIVIEAEEPRQKPPRPVYPDSEWEGTVVAEFAKLCTADNHIPRKLFAEAFRTGIGAVVGDRLYAEGYISRSFTILIAPKGLGKGTAVRRAIQFFHRLPNLPGGFLSGQRNFPWKPKGIGAYETLASSVPGLGRMIQDSKKLVETSPHLCWGMTTPRVLFVNEELKTLLSTLFIEGGVGMNFEGVLCQLWDDTAFVSPGTATREAVYGEAQLSVLGGITPNDWFEILGNGDVIGSGFMSRLNLIGTEGKYPLVAHMKLPDFDPLRAAFCPRIEALANCPAILTIDKTAEGLMAEWMEILPEDSERLNVQAWRTALLLAWLRGHDVINAADVSSAIALANYQVQSRAYYRVVAVRNAQAGLQVKIQKVLSERGAMTHREVYKAVHAERWGTAQWKAAWDGLVLLKLVIPGKDETWVNARN